MEFPIKIIITVVVALVVGVLLLQVSRNIINASESRLDSIITDDIRVIEIEGTLNLQQAGYIAEECNKMGKADPNTDLCFVVMVSGNPIDCLGINWGLSEPLTGEGNGNTLYYYYRAPGVHISCN